MIYTTAIRRAIRFSTKTHEVYQKQRRKGKDIPYIIHPLTVGLILAGAGAREEAVVAGILHDTIEDSIPEKKVTRSMLAERFGEDVAELVASVSEEDKSLSWEERKQQALGHVGVFSRDALLVKSADIIANASELLEDYGRDGEDVFLRFNAPQEKILQHYVSIIGAVLGRWEENPLADDLRSLSDELARLRSGTKDRRYRITFGSLTGEGLSKMYEVTASDEEDARRLALNRLLTEETDGVLLDSPLQMSTVEEISDEEPTRHSYSNHKKYETLSEWWEHAGQGKFPLQVPMAITRLQNEHGMTFQEAFEYLVEKRVIVFIDDSIDEE